MHISLDSALGQQRRLNSVGESITQIAPDPAAAYSLRSLTGADPKVVRVRRDTGGGAGDNDEQDFTASGISSGALVDFVGSGNDGFVETWYDQSGNGNNGTQTTASLQPKIVDAGSLITMNGKPAFLFTSSSSSYFNMTSELSGISDFSTFFVSEVVDRSGRGILVAKDSQNYLRMNDATFQFEASNTDSGAINFNSTLTDGGQFSLAFIRASNTLTAYVAGSAQSNTVSNSDNFAINKLLGRDVNFQTWINKAQELIFYTSDQTANVSTLNTNMASHYEIS